MGFIPTAPAPPNGCDDEGGGIPIMGDDIPVLLIAAADDDEGTIPGEVLACAAIIGVCICCMVAFAVGVDPPAGILILRSTPAATVEGDGDDPTGRLFRLICCCCC